MPGKIKRNNAGGGMEKKENSIAPVLIGGKWRQALAAEVFSPVNPATGEKIGRGYPVSNWDDLQMALEESKSAVLPLAQAKPDQKAKFFCILADQIEKKKERIIEQANEETGLPLEPRLSSVEFPRLIDQINQAAAACEERSWCQATIDSRLNIRSKFGPLGGVVIIFSPNNFPLAFNAVGGSDFVSALAVGNPVICKANPNHPGTTQLMAEAALDALRLSGLPLNSLQMLYHFSPDDGYRLVTHPYVAAVAFTGSRQSGLKIKEAAEKAGKLIYAEMSSVNPVFFLPEILKERPDSLAQELFSSCTLGTGQFCTKPGLIVLIDEAAGRSFLDRLKEVFSQLPPGYLLSRQVHERLQEEVERLKLEGAKLLAGGFSLPGPGFRFAPTLFMVEGKKFLAHPERFQTEIFGPLTIAVLVSNAAEMLAVAFSLEGNLAASIYVAENREDWQIYQLIEPVLRMKAGRLLNNKMPTGVAVSPAMHHGGPFPATSHPGFTSVGIPASFLRFAARQAYENVPEERLPEELRAKNPTGRMWRFIDGEWTKRDLGD